MENHYGFSYHSHTPFHGNYLQNRYEYSYHSLEGATPALSNISFTVTTGEFLAVVGPSGCGKSTLLSLLSGLLEPEEGTVFIDGAPIRESGASIGYMLQKDHPSELSGGMRQRAALIRTLALKPDLLRDEPFSALDYQTRLSVCDDIRSIIRRTGKTAILITHDLSEAISVADRVVVLSSRPGQVKAVLPITFAEKNISPLKRRNAPEFSSYFNQVWEELQ